MSGKHHKGLHHHYTTSAAANDSSGWVEGITALQDSHPATALMLSDAPCTAPLNPGLNTAQGRSGGLAGHSMGEVPDGQQSFAACLEHALEVMEAELTAVGEVVLEVGQPSGWGPSGLTSEQRTQVVAELRRRAGELSADVTVLREKTMDMPGPGSTTVAAATADVLLRRQARAAPPIEVRVAVIGNVDSGKSTLVGVLTRSVLDDGRGYARSKVFKHQHEETTGRTSSIGQHNLCLDAGGRVLNDPMFRSSACQSYISRASKVLTLVDLAGHEKYFRTTAYGLTGHLPDYACLLLGANMGMVGMCREHLGVALALKVPVFFVVTKVDLCPEHILKNTLQSLASILKKPGVRKKPYLVRGVDDVILCARNLNSDALAPIFLTSAVTGQGMDLVRMFYNLVPQRQRWAERQAELAEFIIDETFGVPGVGTVVAGTVKRGVISASTPLLLGPDIGDGSFKSAAIKSIHYKRLPVGQVVAGQTAALALKRVKRNQVRKGMVLVHERSAPAACWEFDADIAILTHSTTIQPRYQAVIHCEIIRQAARVVAMDAERLRSGDRACVRFRFLQHPEYVTPGTRFVFREGRTKGIGLVVATEHQTLDQGPGGQTQPGSDTGAPAAAAAAAGNSSATTNGAGGEGGAAGGGGSGGGLRGGLARASAKS